MLQLQFLPVAITRVHFVALQFQLQSGCSSFLPSWGFSTSCLMIGIIYLSQGGIIYSKCQMDQASNSGAASTEKHEHGIPRRSAPFICCCLPTDTCSISFCTLGPTRGTLPSDWVKAQHSIFFIKIQARTASF